MVIVYIVVVVSGLIMVVMLVRFVSVFCNLFCLCLFIWCESMVCSVGMLILVMYSIIMVG